MLFVRCLTGSYADVCFRTSALAECFCLREKQHLVEILETSEFVEQCGASSSRTKLRSADDANLAVQRVVQAAMKPDDQRRRQEP